MLFNLPDDQQISIISQWVDIKDLALLDSACCNNGFRASFLRLTQLRQCIFPKHDLATTVDEARWILNRELKFHAVTMFSEIMFDTQLCDKLIASSGQTMKNLKLSSWTCPEQKFEYGKKILKIKDAVESVAKNCFSLEIFAVECYKSHVQLGGALSQTLVRNQHLHSVLLDNCDAIDNASLNALLQLPNLWSLLFSHCSFCDSVDLVVGDKSKLVNFTCKNVIFEGGDIIGMCKFFPKLLYLDATDVSCAQLVLLLSLCPMLDSVYLQMTEPIADEVAQQMVTAWPKLALLHLHYAEGATCSEQAMLTFVKNCPLLISLNLVTEERTQNFAFGVQSCPFESNDSNLSCLYELNVDSLTRSGLTEVLAFCPHLHVLAIYHRVPFTFPEHELLTGNTDLHPAETALDLVANSSIKELHLHNYTHLSSESIGLLGQVKELYLSGMQGDFDEDDLLQLCTRCPALRVLYPAGCDSVSYGAVINILDNCPKLVRFRYWNKVRKELFYVMPPELQLLCAMMYKTYPLLEDFDFYLRQSSLPYQWEE